jgi:hypothetical protein
MGNRFGGQAWPRIFRAYGLDHCDDHQTGNNLCPQYVQHPRAVAKQQGNESRVENCRSRRHEKAGFRCLVLDRSGSQGGSCKGEYSLALGLFGSFPCFEGPGINALSFRPHH